MSDSDSDKPGPVAMTFGYAVVLGGPILVVALIIWGVVSCSSDGSSKHANASTAAASSTSSVQWPPPPLTNWSPPSTPVTTWTPLPTTVAPPATTPAADPADDSYLAAVRAAGAQGSDDELNSDGMAACLDLNQAGETAISAAAQLTGAPFNFSQHAADEIVINAVRYTCPTNESKIDNPTDGN